MKNKSIKNYSIYNSKKRKNERVVSNGRRERRWKLLDGVDFGGYCGIDTAFHIGNVGYC